MAEMNNFLLLESFYKKYKKGKMNHINKLGCIVIINIGTTTWLRQD